MRIASQPDAVVAAITGKYPLVCAEGAYWEWDGKRWRQLTIGVVTWFVAHLRSHKVFRVDRGAQRAVNISTPGFLNPLRGYLDGCPEIDRPDFFKEAPRGLSLANGFLRFRDDGQVELLAHAPDHKCRFFLDTAFDAQALCPFTLEVLGSYFTKDSEGDGEAKKAALLEFLAICAFGQATANRRGAILWVTGEKGTGKSTLLEALVDAVFDRETVGSVEPHKFDDPTERFRLVGKLLNFKDEVESRAIRDAGSVKALVSGSEVSVKKLYRDLMPARITCGHLLVANEMAVLADSSGALHDRVIRIHFTHRYDRAFEDPRRIALKIKAERAGIINLLADVYRRMLERGDGLPQIAVPKSALRRQQESALEADGLRMFINQAVVFDVAGRVSAAEVRQHYNRWREPQGIKREADAQELAKKLREVLPECCPEPTTYKRKALFRVRLLDERE